jgi:hypothetical protein
MMYLIPRLGGRDDIQDLRVKGWLAAADLEDLRLAFGLQQSVEHGLHLCQTQVVAGARVGKTHGAGKVAAGSDLDDGHAGMLLVLGAQSAIKRAPLLYLRGEVVGYLAGLVVSEGVEVPGSIGQHPGLVPAVFRTVLAQIHGTVANEHQGIDHSPALRAQAAGKFMKDMTAVPLLLFSNHFLLDYRARRTRRRAILPMVPPSNSETKTSAAACMLAVE